MKIRSLRESAGLTQKQAAEMAGVAQANWSQWENEVILPRIRQLPAIAMVLGVTVGDLFAEEVDAG